ncbi:hypothetical protein [Pseudanabaena sp. FACHB-2040]|uniref:hypothetical protein n=1 Tax=Pseudanabaena sp. FACHB-2040 TaxID=2692859 RepID=UPI0016899D25|nr:hypothetical protein [Pseudanabaena sp. FACHB-2040]MBD2256347.1 hypothetical protein [Pseudanabaena sp. FACHB-2040]
MQPDSPVPSAELVKLVNQLIASRQITLAQYQQISATVLADGTVDEQERRQINRLFDAIQAGTVKFMG